MTMQMPDKLENEFNGVDFGHLSLYGVVTGDINGNHGWGEFYRFNATATPKGWRTTACSNGYISCYVLNERGELVLDRFEYHDTEENRPDEPVDETLEGDFWLVMKEYFYGLRTYVPFVAGKVVADRSKWEFEKPKEVTENTYLKVYTSAALLSVDFESARAIGDFKVYVDGNVECTNTAKDAPPENGYMIRMRPGRRRIVVREFDGRKLDRKESNTIHFDAVEGQTLSFHLVGRNGQFFLLENFE